MLIVADPPYLNTDNSQYKMQEQSGLYEFLEIITLFSYPHLLFFNSTKSQALDLFKFYAKGCEKARANFDKKKIYSKTSTMNGNCSRMHEILIHIDNLDSIS